MKLSTNRLKHKSFFTMSGKEPTQVQQEQQTDKPNYRPRRQPSMAFESFEDFQRYVQRTTKRKNNSQE